MPRRTAEANKAILAAWNNEQALVQEGKGTREWSPQQQRDILEKGKAYDDDGYAFQGHHMKSAEKNPEYQGDPLNIQFLTRSEHLDAHCGNWQTPTNWFYNPITKERVNFGDGPFIPCEAFPLQEPVAIPKATLECEKTQIERPVEVSKAPQTENTKTVTPKSLTFPVKNPIAKRPKKQSGGILRALKSACSETLHFVSTHPKLVVSIVVGAVAAGITAAADSYSSESGDNTSDENNDYSCDSSFPVVTEEPQSLCSENDEDSESSTKPYTPNEVSEHTQRYHYKDGSTKERTIAKYPRHGKNSE